MIKILHQIYVTLDWLHREAQTAYWHNRRDCGSDFVETGICVDCQHFTMCQNQAHVQAGLDILSLMVRD